MERGKGRAGEDKSPFSFSYFAFYFVFLVIYRVPTEVSRVLLLHCIAWRGQKRMGMDGDGWTKWSLGVRLEYWHDRTHLFWKLNKIKYCFGTVTAQIKICLPRFYVGMLLSHRYPRFLFLERGWHTLF